MKLPLLAILLTLTLQGCAARKPTNYIKLGGSPTLFQQDYAECKFYLETHGNRIAWPGLLEDCLTNKGWRRE